MSPGTVCRLPIWRTWKRDIPGATRPIKHIKKGRTKTDSKGKSGLGGWLLLLCPQPEEDIVLHMVNQPLESCQVAKPHLIEASQGDP